MDSIQFQPLLERLYQHAISLEFDWFTLKLNIQRQISLRIAHSVPCRENIDKEDIQIYFQGSLDQRQASVVLPVFDEAQIISQMDTLRDQILNQTPDLEMVAPNLLEGSFVWKTCLEDLWTAVDQSRLMMGIEHHLAPLRPKGYRITGYIEILESEKLQKSFRKADSRSFTLTTREHGANLSVTLDAPSPEEGLFSKPDLGKISSARRGAVSVKSDALAALFGDALGEALQRVQWQQRLPAKEKALDPGHYTVILHPSAVAELLHSAFMYNMFDQRKIAEGRTYLGQKEAQSSYPVGLTLKRSLKLDLPNRQTYNDIPFNNNLVPCESMNLIEQGRIHETFVSAYWSQKTGQPETFSGYDAPALSLDYRPPSFAESIMVANSLEDLIASTEEGLFIANFWYLRMVTEMDGLLTGMTRDGFFTIKNGVLNQSLINMRWHDNPFRILANITGFSTDKKLYGLSRLVGSGRMPLSLVPALRITGFHLSSASKF